MAQSGNEKEKPICLSTLIQYFAKSLSDVADNLGRASSAAKESFSKIDSSEDAAGAVKKLKTLLEGVEMNRGTIIKRTVHNNFSGLFFGLPFTKPNPEFVQSVKSQFSSESKLLLVCQEGLRSAAAANKLEEAGYHNRDNHFQLGAQMCLTSKKKSACKRITGFQFLPQDPSKILVTSVDSKVRIIDGVNVIGKYKGPRNAGNQSGASFTWDGKHIVSASDDSNVYM